MNESSILHFLESAVSETCGIEKIDYDHILTWPITPDGGGDSLQRINLAAYGRDCSNWQADSPSPGS